MLPVFPPFSILLMAAIAKAGPEIAIKIPGKLLLLGARATRVVGLENRHAPGNGRERGVDGGDDRECHADGALDPKP